MFYLLIMEWLSSKVNESVTNFNHSEVTANVFDLYEIYKEKELEQFVNYRIVAYIFGIVIFLSNITVVISSGLILKKGQQPKSTYLLLGNVSLADTIIGLSIMFGITIENPMSSNPLCIFQIGILVCPAMVSIFSVGLIAVDRYIYILHGLYYQRWFNTTKVRIGILCIWLIGITLGFLPAVGWVNTELQNSRCYYVSLFPGYLILLNSLLSIVPIILVAVLYSIILVKALKNVKEINAQAKSIHRNKTTVPEMRIYRGNVNYKKTAQSVKFPTTYRNVEITRSASFNGTLSSKSTHVNQFHKLYHKSKSNDNLNDSKLTNNCITFPIDKGNQSNFESNFSIYSINSSVPEQGTTKKNIQKIALSNLENGQQKSTSRKEPNKWRAIIIVMLTSGSFIFTWMPFFITVIFYVFCQEKLTNPKCMHLRIMLSGPIATLAFLNSILNPLIYAWWHKGFQRSIRAYFRKYINQYFRKRF